MSKIIHPIEYKEREPILDTLRGLALLGICLANYPEFSLYSFLDNSITASMPTAGTDRIVRYLQYIFIDGKFYTLFSILFGIGFSIILSNSEKKGTNGLKIFYRRMAVLFIIGLFHLIFLWAGDILILYAFLGFFLPFFRDTPNKKILIYAGILLLVPVLIDVCVVLLHWNLAGFATKATEHFHNKYGITTENFPVWLVEHHTYSDVLKFNIAGSFIRMQEFIEGNRAFKVMGLFLLGFYIGRNKLYMNFEKHSVLFIKFCRYGFAIGLPSTLLYAYSAMNGHPMGWAVHSGLYAFSILPLSLAYATMVCLLYVRHKQHKIFRILAVPGRMALTNYMMQSVLGIIIFYGIGWGFGASLGLIEVELIAAGVFIFQVSISYLWLSQFNYGLLEWVWRMLTYKKWLKIVK